MRRFRYIAHMSLAALAATLLSAPVQAQISAVVQESGNISVSIDGAGGNNASESIDVDKPAGATVRGAYLSAASNFDRIINDNDITLAGTGVTVDQSVINNAGIANPTFFNNIFSDVTDIVKPIIDAAPAGITTLTITETDTTTIDGSALAVIFDDPNVTENSSVILLFGGNDTTGDSFQINLAEPLDLSSPDARAELCLAISFGFQGTGMASEVDINGSRLTSAAGGQDDGEGANGALITVGGLGDSTNNPADPFAGPNGDPTFDDELYDLLPFVNDGDMVINADTLNPSDDDNIFFGCFITSVPAAIGESILLAPLNATLPTGETHTVTATVVDDNNDPVVGRNVDFEVLSGPNAGEMGSDTTDANGEATFSYVGDDGPGTDTIIASMINSEGDPQDSNTVEVLWEAECFLFLGDDQVAIPFANGDTLLTLPLMMFPVTLDDIPVFQIPDSPALLGLTVYFQVYMNNPIVFPDDPYKMSNGMAVQIGNAYTPYGTGTGMELWSNNPRPDLGSQIELQFSIEGL